jgi:hypothetical protein
MPASADSSASAAAFAERDGLLWIAFGERYVSEAEHSARSAAAAAPMLARALLADREPATGVFDVVRRIEPGHIRAKVDFLAESPFARTLYLDSDTRVVGELADVFELLARCDVALAHDFARKRQRFAREIPAYAAIPYAFPEMNGGVLLYSRASAAIQFLERWRELFHQWKHVTQGWDQATLRIALWQCDLRLCTLPPEYNVRSAAVRARMAKLARSGAEPALLEPRILHWHGLDRKPRFWSRLSPKYRPYPY